MKIANHPKDHRSIVAAQGSPSMALCPYCQGKVTLRRRKLMVQGYAYFWRHQDNHNHNCNGRFRPIKP